MRCFYGTVAQHWTELGNLNHDRYDISIVPNPGRTDGKASAHSRNEFTAVRVVALEMDRLPTQWHLAPSFIVGTSPGRGHAYWRITDATVAEFNTIQKRAHLHYGDAKATATGCSDPDGLGIHHPLRLAGTVRFKPDQKPNVVTIEPAADGTYTRKQFLAGLPDLPPEPERERAQSTIKGKPTTAAMLREACSWIDWTFDGSDPGGFDRAKMPKRMRETFEFSQETWASLGRMLLNGEIKIVGEEPDWEQLLDDAMSGKLWCERLGLGDGREFATYNGLDGMKARIGTATYTGTTSYTVGTIFALARAFGWKHKLSTEDMDAATASAGDYETEAEPAAPDKSDFATTITAVAGSQIDMADRFARAFSGKLHYVMAEKRWLWFDGACWRDDTRGRVRALLKDWLGKVSVNTPGAESYLRAIASERTLSGVERLVQISPSIAAAPEDFDTDPDILCTPGGIVDLRTGEMRPAQSADMCRKCTAVAPALRGSPEAECPRFMDFLDWLTVSRHDLQEYHQRCAGYFLTGHVHERALFVPKGTGNNGKTVYYETVLGIMGDYGIGVEAELFVQLRNPSRSSRDFIVLLGKRFALAAELEEQQVWSEAKIKRMTGGDKLPGRKLYGEAFDFGPTHKLVVPTNDMPAFPRGGLPMKNRLQVQPFDNTIADSVADGELPAKIRAEWPGVLRWMIDGAMAWHKDGLAPPACVTNASDSALDASNPIAGWRWERTELDGETWIADAALYSDYADFCRREGVVSIGRGTFIKRLEAITWETKGHDGNHVVRHLERHKRNTGQGFVGMKLLPKAEEGRAVLEDILQV